MTSFSTSKKLSSSSSPRSVKKTPKNSTSQAGTPQAVTPQSPTPGHANPSSTRLPGHVNPSKSHSQSLKPNSSGAKKRPSIPLLKTNSFNKKTARVAAKRGDYLSNIDAWLAAVHSAKDNNEKNKALEQLRDAADDWLEKHGTTSQEKEAKSVTHRREVIQDVYQAASNALDPTKGDRADYKTALGDSSKQTGHRRTVAEESISGTAESITGMSGIAGDMDDANATRMGGEGLGIADGVKADFLDGVNSVAGLLALKGVRQDWEGASTNHEKAQVASEAAASAGQIFQGVAAFTKGGVSQAQGEENVSSGVSAFGESGAAMADGTAMIAGAIATINGLRDFIQDRRYASQQEKIVQGLDIAESAGTTLQSGIKTGLGIHKTVGEATGNSIATGTTQTVATAAASIGLVTGVIQLARGGVDLYRSASDKSSIESVEVRYQEIAASLSEKIEPLSKIIASIRPTDKGVAHLSGYLKNLENTLKELQSVKATTKAGIDGMEKVANRRMESGTMKAARGGLGVVSSALALSGVGAPVALSVGVLAGIMSLSHTTLNLARDRKESKLTTVAARLTDQGRPKGKKDKETPAYRAMEKRIYKCYYNHIPEVMKKTQPSGMQPDDFKIVQQFAWEDKKTRANNSEKTIVDEPTKASLLDEKIRQNHWIEAHKPGTEQITHIEKPKRFKKIDYKVSASAHKSSQANEASKTDIAQALYALCQNSYDETAKKFKSTTVIPQGNAEDVQAYKSVTLGALLSAANITEVRWQKWVKEANEANDKANKVNNTNKPISLKAQREKLESHIKNSLMAHL